MNVVYGVLCGDSYNVEDFDPVFKLCITFLSSSTDVLKFAMVFSQICVVFRSQFRFFVDVCYVHII